MFTLLFLHIALMFGAVALHAGSQLLTLVAVHTGQLPAVAPITRVWFRAVPIVTGLFGLGAVFGIGAGLAIGYDLLARWLVISYVLFIGSGMWSNFMTVPLMRRIANGAAAAALAEGPGAMTAAPEETVDVGGGGRVATWRLDVTVAIDLLFFVALIYDMVVKPLP